MDRLVCVKGMYPAPYIHEQKTTSIWLRNNVHDYKHILTYNIFETNVTNCVNNTTHTDKLTVQH